MPQFNPNSLQARTELNHPNFQMWRWLRKSIKNVEYTNLHDELKNTQFNPENLPHTVSGKMMTLSILRGDNADQIKSLQEATGITPQDLAPHLVDTLRLINEPSNEITQLKGPSLSGLRWLSANLPVAEIEKAAYDTRLSQDQLEQFINPLCEKLNQVKTKPVSSLQSNLEHTTRLRSQISTP